MCPYVFMANSQTDMEEWLRALRRVTGVPNGGLVKLHVLTEADDRIFYSILDHVGHFAFLLLKPDCFSIHR